MLLSMAEFICPNCSTKLLNVQPNIEGQIRCSNCDQRFSPRVPTESTPTTNDLRVPAKATYGLLKVFCFVLPIGFLAPIFYLVQVGRTPTYFSPVEVMVYLAAGLLGLLAVLVLNRFELVESGLTNLAAMHGALPERYPSPLGSNLPYILPLMATGSLLIIGSILYFCETALFFEASMCSIVGCFLFLAGLAAGDVRRLTWRLLTLGRSLSAKIDSVAAHPYDRDGNTPNFLLAAAVASVLVFVRANSPSKPYWYYVALIPSLTILSNCYTLYRCHRDVFEVNREWEAIQSKLRGNSGAVIFETGAEGWLNGLSWVLVGCGALPMWIVMYERRGGDEPLKFAAAWVCLLGMIWMGRTIRLLKRILLNGEGLARTVLSKESRDPIKCWIFLPISRFMTLKFVALALVAGLFAWGWCNYGDLKSGSIYSSDGWIVSLFILSFPCCAALWFVAVLGLIDRILDSFARMKTTLSATSAPRSARHSQSASESRASCCR